MTFVNWPFIPTQGLKKQEKINGVNEAIFEGGSFDGFLTYSELFLLKA